MCVEVSSLLLEYHTVDGMDYKQRLISQHYMNIQIHFSSSPHIEKREQTKLIVMMLLCVSHFVCNDFQNSAASYLFCDLCCEWPQFK